MTGPVVPPGGEELREAIVRVLCDGGHCGTCKRRAAELLPVFLAFAEEQGRRRAAEELGNAADGVEATQCALNALGCSDTLARVLLEIEASLRARAAALAAENARPE